MTLASLRGKPVLVNFWASWCGPCVSEAPALERFAAAGGRLVAVDWSDGLGAARAFVRSRRWTFPVLADPDGNVGRNWGVEDLPTTFVLDAQGHIVSTLHGAQSVAELRRAIANA